MTGPVIAVAWQSRFVDGKWSECSREHVEWVRSVPHEWPGYEVRELYAAPQPAPAIDLEQFREAVESLRLGATRAGHHEECDRLLALIDGQPNDNGVRVDRGALQMALNVLRRSGKDEVADALAGGVIDGQANVRSSSEHSDSLTPVAHKKLQGLQEEGFIVNGVAIFNPTTGRRGLVDYLGYVGWQAKLQASLNEQFGNPEELRTAIRGFIAASWMPSKEESTEEMRATYSYWHKQLIKHAGAMGYVEAEEIALQPTKGKGE